PPIVAPVNRAPPFVLPEKSRRNSTFRPTCCGSGNPSFRKSGRSSAGEAAVTIGLKMSTCCDGYGNSSTRRGTRFAGFKSCSASASGEKNRRSTHRQHCFGWNRRLPRRALLRPRGRLCKPLWKRFSVNSWKSAPCSTGYLEDEMRARSHKRGQLHCTARGGLL